MKSQEKPARPLSGTVIKRSNCKLRQEILLGLLLIFLLVLTVEVGLVSDLSETGGEEVSTQSLRNSFAVNHHALSSRNTDRDKRNQKNQKESEADEKQNFMNHKAKIGTAGPFPYYPATPLVAEDHNFKLFEPAGGQRFEEYKHGDSPYTFSVGESDALARSRRYHIKNAMRHAWAGYEKYAFGMDEFHPISMKGNSRWGGIGTTLVDSLDTLWLMDMKDEFYRARDWCKTEMDYNTDKDVSVFETTIRSLGGLLSAFDWSRDTVFLDQAKELGKRLFRSFDSKSGIPYSQTNLKTGTNSNQQWSPMSTNIAEAGTLQIEFRALGRFSGIMEYKTKSEKVFSILDAMKPTDGLYSTKVANKEPMARLKGVLKTFGPMADSFYEYMLKIWIQGGQTEREYREMYDKAIQGMHDQLLSVSTPSELVFIADQQNGKLHCQMDHLVCFMGGLLALGAYTDPQGLDSERAQRDLKTAKALTYTCYQMYARMPTGTSPEWVYFSRDQDFRPGKNHYLMRPEAVESFFVLYHLTGDPIYREWGWEIFQAIERYCKTEAGYGQLENVMRPDKPPEDKMESFFLAETLKYLYLLFDPETPIDLLHKHVFNTEAHPMRIFPVMDKEDGVVDQEWISQWIWYPSNHL